MSIQAKGFFLWSLILLQYALGASSASALDGIKVPNRFEVIQLIRATLGVINDANVTSNYSGLYGLGAPEFRARYSINALTSACDVLRSEHVDLSEISRMEPAIEDAVVQPHNGVVQYKGYFSTRASQLQFRLSYQYVAQRWRLYGFDLVFRAPNRANLSVWQLTLPPEGTRS